MDREEKTAGEGQALFLFFCICFSTSMFTCAYVNVCVCMCLWRSEANFRLLFVVNFLPYIWSQCLSFPGIYCTG